MFLFLHYEMLDVHVNSKDTLNKLNDSIKHRLLFDNLLIGVNIVSTGCIDDIANYVLSIPIEKLDTVTYGDVIKSVGQYEDLTGKLL